jgi:hypothetical protein
MSEFFAKYWKWMAGAFGLVVVLRSYKVATSSAFYNAVTASSVPYAHAGSAAVSQIGGTPSKTSALPPPTEQGINTGSENGSEAANFLNRATTVSMGLTNTYIYTSPATGVQTTYYIHTAQLWTDANYNATGQYQYATGYLADSSTDSVTPLPMLDMGTNWYSASPLGPPATSTTAYTGKLNNQTPTIFDFSS